MPVITTARNAAVVLLAASWLLTGSIAARAAPFLPTYTGPANEALDVASISVTFDGTNFVLTSTSFSPLATAPAGTAFVWGIDRGAGTARFVAGTPSIGSNVLFDSVLAINPLGGTAAVTLLTPSPGPATALPAADLSISGNTITAVLPASLLPSAGFLPANYTFDLWPRLPASNSPSSPNSQIAQFIGVTNSVNPVNIGATLVPEPASLALLAGAGLLTLVRSRRRAG